MAIAIDDAAMPSPDVERTSNMSITPCSYQLNAEELTR